MYSVCKRYEYIKFFDNQNNNNDDQNICQRPCPAYTLRVTIHVLTGLRGYGINHYSDIRCFNRQREIADLGNGIEDV